MSKKKPLTIEEKQECDALKRVWATKKTDLHLTYAVVADRYEISPAGVSHYINGVNALNAKAAAMFATQLEAPVASFSERLSREIEKLTAGFIPEGGEMTAKQKLFLKMSDQEAESILKTFYSED